LDQYHKQENYQNQIENLNLQIQESELKVNEIQGECQYTTDKWQKILDEGIKDVRTNCEARKSRVVMERI
jgi:flagellar biosynthesis chaperone FliJ